MVSRFKGIALVGIFIFAASCSESKQSGDGAAATPEQVDANTEPEPSEDAVDPFVALFDNYEKAIISFADACKVETTIQAPKYNFYTGFAADSTRAFTNLAGVLLACNTDQQTLIVAQDAIIAELNLIANPVAFDEAVTKVMSFFSASLDKSGLQSHFETAVSETTVTFGAGLVKKEDFLFNEGINFFIASSFDATAVGPTSVTFAYGGQSVQSSVVVSEYTEAVLAVGQARYENAQGASPSCASCHQQANGTDHSPLKIGTCSDAEIVGALVTGSYTPDATNPNSFCAGYTLQIANHAWTFLDDAQRDATIAYLRTLPLPISAAPAAALR